MWVHIHTYISTYIETCVCIYESCEYNVLSLSILFLSLYSLNYGASNNTEVSEFTLFVVSISLILT